MDVTVTLYCDHVMTRDFTLDTGALVVATEVEHAGGEGVEP